MREYMGNIHTLWANIKFICTSIRNKKKRKPLLSFSVSHQVQINLI